MKQNWVWASRLGISWILKLSRLFYPSKCSQLCTALGRLFQLHLQRFGSVQFSSVQFSLVWDQWSSVLTGLVVVRSREENSCPELIPPVKHSVWCLDQIHRESQALCPQSWAWMVLVVVNPRLSPSWSLRAVSPYSPKIHRTLTPDKPRFTRPSIPDSFVFMMYRNISKVWNMLFLPLGRL